MPSWTLSHFLKPFVALILLAPGVMVRTWLVPRMSDGRLKKLLLRRIR